MRRKEKFTFAAFMEGSETQLSSNQSSKPCSFYLQGYCRFGDRCQFSHSQSTETVTNSTSQTRERGRVVQMNQDKGNMECFTLT